MGKKNQSYDIQKITAKMLPTLKRADVQRAALFGSFVRGEATRKSDVDLVVQFVGQKSLLELIALQQDLEELLRRKVDVLTYGGIHPLLRSHILEEQKVIYEKQKRS